MFKRPTLCEHCGGKKRADQVLAGTRDGVLVPKLVDRTLATYRYNGLGQRASKTAGGVLIKYVYGSDGQLLAELNATGNARVEYMYLNGQVLAQRSISWASFFIDELGHLLVTGTGALLIGGTILDSMASGDDARSQDQSDSDSKICPDCLLPL